MSVLSATGFTDNESEIFWYCAEAGALTTRSVIRRWGPKPTWSRLLELNYLRKVDTQYGEVIGVGDVGRAQVKSSFPRDFESLPYLTGANSLADRAYQQDALIALGQMGYTVHYHEYRRASPMVIKHRASDRHWTHQIVSTCLRVPESEARMLALRWKQRVKEVKDVVGVEVHEFRLGFPHLYATISGGGLSKQKVEALYRKASSWSSDWRSPMIVVVPDLEQHRDVLRRVCAEQRACQLSDRTSEPETHFGTYPVMRLIEQPLPKSVGRTPR